LFTSVRTGCGADPLLAGDGSGRNWILTSGVQLGRISRGHLVPLPPGTGFTLQDTPGGCRLRSSGPHVMGVGW